MYTAINCDDGLRVFAFVESIKRCDVALDKQQVRLHYCCVLTWLLSCSSCVFDVWDHDFTFIYLLSKYATMVPLLEFIELMQQLINSRLILDEQLVRMCCCMFVAIYLLIVLNGVWSWDHKFTLFIYCQTLQQRRQRLHWMCFSCFNSFNDATLILDEQEEYSATVCDQLWSCYWNVNLLFIYTIPPSFVVIICDNSNKWTDSGVLMARGL